jgi:uncharacterized protein
MTPPFLRESPAGVLLAVKVQPRASRNAIHGLHGAELKISVTAPPVDSAANEALVRFLAEELGCSRGSVSLIRGETSRHKTLLLQGLAASEIAVKLGFG